MGIGVPTNFLLEDDDVVKFYLTRELVHLANSDTLWHECLPLIAGLSTAILLRSAFPILSLLSGEAVATLIHNGMFGWQEAKTDHKATSLCDRKTTEAALAFLKEAIRDKRKTPTAPAYSATQIAFLEARLSHQN